MDSLEELIHNDLQQYLLSVNEIDERQGLPQTVCQGLCGNRRTRQRVCFTRA